jgi:hypothetical protein
MPLAGRNINLAPQPMNGLLRRLGPSMPMLMKRRSDACSN